MALREGRRVLLANMARDGADRQVGEDRYCRGGCVSSGLPEVTWIRLGCVGIHLGYDVRFEEKGRTRLPGAEGGRAN